MANEIEISLAEIKGTLGVIKSWGLGIALFIGGLGAGSFGYVVSISGDVGELKSEMKQIKETQEDEVRQQLADIQAKLDRLTAQTPETTPETPPEKTPPAK